MFMLYTYSTIKLMLDTYSYVEIERVMKGDGLWKLFKINKSKIK